MIIYDFNVPFNKASGSEHLNVEIMYLILTRHVSIGQGFYPSNSLVPSGSRKQKASEARRAFCRATVGDLGYPAAGVAGFLGVTTSALARAALAEELPDRLPAG